MRASKPLPVVGRGVGRSAKARITACEAALTQPACRCVPKRARLASPWSPGPRPATGETDPAVRSDLDMFPFPILGNQWDAENAIDA